MPFLLKTQSSLEFADPLVLGVNLLSQMRQRRVRIEPLSANPRRETQAGEHDAAEYQASAADNRGNPALHSVGRSIARMENRQDQRNRLTLCDRQIHPSFSSRNARELEFAGSGGPTLFGTPQHLGEWRVTP
jgi:hypothetical protein